MAHQGITFRPSQFGKTRLSEAEVPLSSGESMTGMSGIRTWLPGQPYHASVLVGVGPFKEMVQNVYV